LLRLEVKTLTIASNLNQCIASIKGIEAQLSSLAINSIDREAQRKFHQAMMEIGDIKQDLLERKNIIELEEPQYKKP
jgi:hypothetical protein